MRIERRRLSAGRLLRVVGWGGEAEGAKTYAVPPGVPLPSGVADALASEGRGSDTGVVLFLGDEESHLVVPPFPVEQEACFEGWRVDVLQELLDRPRRIGVLLLRLGGFAVGIFEKETLVASKVGSRFVKGRHSKGGSSQARFQRRREQQARVLFGKACEVLEAKIEAYRWPLDHFVYGGDRRTLASFEKACTYTQRLEPIRLKRILNIGDPKKATLDALPRLLYESAVFTLADEVDGPGMPS